MENSYGVYTHLNSPIITKKCLLFLGHDMKGADSVVGTQVRPAHRAIVQTCASSAEDCRYRWHKWKTTETGFRWHCQNCWLVGTPTRTRDRTPTRARGWTPARARGADRVVGTQVRPSHMASAQTCASSAEDCR